MTDIDEDLVENQNELLKYRVKHIELQNALFKKKIEKLNNTIDEISQQIDSKQNEIRNKKKIDTILTIASIVIFTLMLVSHLKVF